MPYDAIYARLRSNDDKVHADSDTVRRSSLLRRQLTIPSSTAPSTSVKPRRNCSSPTARATACRSTRAFGSTAGQRANARRSPSACPSVASTASAAYGISSTRVRRSAPLTSLSCAAGTTTRVYGVDPLTRTRCGSTMEIIAFITDDEVVQRILKHLNRWDPPRRLPANPPTADCTVVYDEDVTAYEEIDEPP